MLLEEGKMLDNSAGKPDVALHGIVGCCWLIDAPSLLYFFCGCCRLLTILLSCDKGIGWFATTVILDVSDVL